MAGGVVVAPEAAGVAVLAEILVEIETNALQTSASASRVMS